VDIHRAGVTRVFVAPNITQETFASQHLTNVLQEVRKQVELARFEVQRLVAIQRSMGHDIRAKQLRYSLEFSVEVYREPARSLIERAVRLQDVLGAIQDCVAMNQRP
jgi:CHAD domain-containing protein